MDSILTSLFLNIFLLYKKFKFVFLIIIVLFLLSGIKILFSIAFLAIIAFIVDFVSVFILNIAGLPGALITLKLKTRSVGLIVSVIGQSFIYSAYVAFIVHWTMLAVSLQGVNILIWPISFLATIAPIWMSSIRAKSEAREDGYWNVQVEAIGVTLVLTFIIFFIFAFIPRIMETIYWWVPYMKP